MKIKKAVITAAGRGERLYPVGDTVQKAMLPIVDSDGIYKPIIQIIAEEAFDSGVEDICVICAPGDEKRYINSFIALRDNLFKVYKGVEWAQEHAGKIEHLLQHLQFQVQEKPLGYGHAVYLAREFTQDEPFLLMLGDHLYVSDIQDKRCAAQIIQLAAQEECSVSAVNPTIEHQIRKYGTLTGKSVLNLPGIYQIEKIMEKPSISQAEQQLQTPGLRAGYYLCFFGMHVLTNQVFNLLQQYHSENESYMLTPALQELSGKDKYLALEVKGKRYDIGKKFGHLQAQIALSMAGADRNRILTTLVDVMAESSQLHED
ncbi:MAG: UTP--glucose-1-phosphate uridylyltransferase [Candidatus Cyclobacteriaceae bacterium M3_2C_046]